MTDNVHILTWIWDNVGEKKRTRSDLESKVLGSSPPPTLALLLNAFSRVDGTFWATRMVHKNWFLLTEIFYITIEYSTFTFTT
ncbi:hypothetical protein ECG_07528 [Echinococcus granulosus]|uniref:Ovule protein n=1 Tax=Echinococcus granulosus TaxID=6210 RepID=A0A068WXB9_ECHGR|nr:hypothetical protein ECG_07528 [Echinococcus granulosus]CDS24500.1 hypothetical protein EgrG_000390300 [Echinococcus granulosus]